MDPELAEFYALESSGGEKEKEVEENERESGETEKEKPPAIA